MQKNTIFFLFDQTSKPIVLLGILKHPIEDSRLRFSHIGMVADAL